MSRFIHGWCLLFSLSLSLMCACAEPMEGNQETAEPKQNVTTEAEENGNSRALYVNGFASILGYRAAEEKLLKFAASHELDVLLLYELHLVLDKDNAADRTHNNALANFISTAKTEYGVKQVAVTGESGGFFKDVIDPYNNSRPEANEKFDIYNLEFEFWIESRIEDVYADTYLVPNGLASDANGAFEFFISSLKEMRTLADASSHDIRVEAYIGWTNVVSDRSQEEVESTIALNVDQLRLHAYRKKPDYGYAARRLEGLAADDPDSALDVSILFSAEKEFMQDWLQSNGMEAAEAEFRKQFDEAASDETKAGINLLGFTYYNYQHSIDVPVK